MNKKLIVTAAAAAVLGGVLGGTAVYFQDTLLEPVRAEFSEPVAPPREGPSFWPAKHGLQTGECRYWLGFSC